MEEHNARLTRVEGEVGGIKNDVTDLKAQMRGFGDILSRIESGISQAQQDSRINPIALATVLITIISILVGGAWIVGGELARHDERSTFQQLRMDRIEQRQWETRNEVERHGVAAEPQQQQPAAL